MKTSLKVILVCFAISGSTVLTAQDNWSFELRPGVNFPTQQIMGQDLNTGFGAEVAFGYRFLEHMGLYGGWGWNQFVIENESADTDFEMTGYTFGLNFTHPINESSFSYMLRGGGIYNHIEIENNEGDIAEDSGHGLGWEVGAGIQWDLGETFKVTPQVGYRTLTREIEFGDLKEDVDFNYLSFGLGITKFF